jgi:hypothetical protein
MKTGFLAGQLHGVGANIARGAVDEYGLPGGYPAIIEEHLPSRDSYNRGRNSFDEVQSLWFLRHHFGRSTAYSAYAPVSRSLVAPYTSSPGLNPETSGPIASTIPDSS